MPESLLTALVLFVALYGLVVGIAAVRVLLRRSSTADPSSGVDSVSIVTLNPSNSPAIRFDGSNGHEDFGDVDVVSLRGPDAETIKSAVRDGERDVVLLPGTGRADGLEWIRALAARCTRKAPVVAGPTIVEHNDHFLPRLEALQQIGYIAFFAGLTSSPPPPTNGCPNLAVRTESLQDTEIFKSGERDELHTLAKGETTFVDEPDAALTCSPASSFDDYFARLVHKLRTAVRSTSWPGLTLAVGLWMTHALLLVCCVVAVGIPAWRQPTLLALLGKMGADGFLLTPSARHYGERGLLRSFVPSELLLVIVVPFAGLFALPGLQELLGAPASSS